MTGHLSTRLNLLPLRLNEKEEDVSDSENSDSDDESDGGSDSDGTSKKKKKKKRRKKKKKTKPAASSRKAKFAGRDRLWARVRNIMLRLLCAFSSVRVAAFQLCAHLLLRILRCSSRTAMPVAYSACSWLLMRRASSRI